MTTKNRSFYPTRRYKNGTGRSAEKLRQWEKAGKRPRANTCAWGSLLLYVDPGGTPLLTITSRTPCWMARRWTWTGRTQCSTLSALEIETLPSAYRAGFEWFGKSRHDVSTYFSFTSCVFPLSRVRIPFIQLRNATILCQVRKVELYPVHLAIVILPIGTLSWPFCQETSTSVEEGEATERRKLSYLYPPEEKWCLLFSHSNKRRNMLAGRRKEHCQVRSHVITCLAYHILLFFTSALKFYEVKVNELYLFLNMCASIQPSLLVGIWVCRGRATVWTGDDA